MNCPPSLRFTASAFAVCFAFSARAQTAASADVVNLPTFNVESSRDSGYQAATSVSATRINTPIADLPFSVSAFTEQFIQDTSPYDLTDVARYAAGVSSGATEFNAGTDTYMIRGFSQTPLRNGFNEGSSNIYVDPATIERVEVVKGPSTLLYGQGAPGGTVNYITKQPEGEPFVVIEAGFGSYSYDRETIDVNQPLIPGRLLFRFNGSYQNGFAYEDIPNRSQTTVWAPSLTWNIGPNAVLKLNAQSFDRTEQPAEVYPMNADIGSPASMVNALKGPGYGSISAELTNQIGIDAANGYSDGTDLGQSPPYAATPRWFDYDNESDYRLTRLRSYDVELDVTLGDNWVSRSDFDSGQTASNFNQTGIAVVYLPPPGSLVYTPGANGAVGAWATSAAWNALTPAQQVAASYAFAQSVQANHSAALQDFQTTSTGGTVAGPALVSRRPRLQMGDNTTQNLEEDLAGRYDFPWGTLKPLVGGFYDASDNHGWIYLNTGSAASPYYQTWDIDPASPTYYINHNPVPISPNLYTTQSSNTLGTPRDAAAYGILNASFLHDTLYLIGGARYNESRTSTVNFLGTTAASVYPEGFKAHYTTPQIGIGYKIASHSMLYANYSTSYLFGGGVLEAPELVNGTYTEAITGNAPPVTAESEEVGFKSDLLDGKVSCTVSVYRIVQEDGTQTTGAFYPTGTLELVTAGVDTRSQGVEFEVNTAPIHGFQLLASASEDDARIVGENPQALIFLGTHPQFAPKTLANLWARFTFGAGPLKNLWIGAGAQYTGTFSGTSSNPYDLYPSYVLWNSALGYDWTWNKRSLSLAAHWSNMTNQVYEPSSEEVGLPSRVTVSLRVKL